MDLDDLDAFVAVAEERHFGRAAQRLGIAQPPLSRRIQQLERELGLRLFERDRRHVAITVEGQHLLPEARKALAQVERLASRAAGLRSGENGRLRVGFVASAAAELMPLLVQTHRAAHPKVEWQLSGCTSADQLLALQSGQLDAGLLRAPDTRPGLAILPVRREGLAVVLPSAHPLASAPSLSLRDLKGWPLILPRAEGPAIVDRIMGACHAAGFEPRVAEASGDLAATTAMVVAGVGLALVIGERYPGIPDSLCLRALRYGEPSWSLAFAWQPTHLTPAVRRLVETARILWPAAARHESATGAPPQARR